MKDTVTFLIATLNEEEDLEDLLVSIKKQTHVKKEIIIVDGGSKDRTVKIASKYTKKVYVLPGTGVTKSKAYGLKKATGGIVHLADADNRFEDRRYMEKMIKIFRTHKPGAVAVRIKPSGRMNFIQRGQAAYRSLIWENNQKGVVTDVDPDNITFCCFEKNLLTKLMDSEYRNLIGNDDLYLAKRTRELGAKTVFDPALSQSHKDPDSWNQIKRQALWYGRVINQRYVPDKTRKVVTMLGALLFWPANFLLFPVNLSFFPSDIIALLLAAMNTLYLLGALYLSARSRDAAGSFFLIYILNPYRAFWFFTGYTKGLGR